ncbi:unnamed protein product [Urochloa decumbens]|uniref:Uncharacterized protein n=1 Tax=Urochloa decumbens TaxID=240449 RepID=A0ABC9A8I9_9POAL
MFGAMSALLSSLPRRLVRRKSITLRRRKSIMSSGFAASRRRRFFPCGAGRRDVSDRHLVVDKRGGTLRKAAKSGSFRVGERKRGGKGSERLLDGGSDGDEEACVWRRTILLGRRCQPLEFEEAIHYDCEGQRLRQPRTPLQSSSPLLMSPAHLHPSEVGYMDRA